VKTFPTHRVKISGDGPRRRSGCGGAEDEKNKSRVGRSLQKSEKKGGKEKLRINKRKTLVEKRANRWTVNQKKAAEDTATTNPGLAGGEKRYGLKKKKRKNRPTRVGNDKKEPAKTEHKGKRLKK